MDEDDKIMLDVFGILPPMVREMNNVLCRYGDEAASEFYEALSQAEKDQLAEEWQAITADRGKQIMVNTLLADRARLAVFLGTTFN